MRTRDIISAGYESFESLIDVVQKKIKFDLVEAWQMKGVLEGRKDAFTIAAEQLERIKELEKMIEEFDTSNYEFRAQELIDSTQNVQKEILKALKMPIDTLDTDDEKFKSIVASKKVAFDFLLEIEAQSDQIKFNLENRTNTESSNRKDFASERAKNGG